MNRTLADQIGATTGILTATALGIYFLSSQETTNLTILGQSVEIGNIVKKALICLFLAGYGANLDRNGAVGIYDTYTFSKEAVKTIRASVPQCFRRIMGITSLENPNETTNTPLARRDYADRAGAILGTITGTCLASHVFSSQKSSDLIIFGTSFGSTNVIKIRAFLFIIGLCANLGRNGAVGFHDTYNYSVQGIKQITDKFEQFKTRFWVGFNSSIHNQSISEEMV